MAFCYKCGAEVEENVKFCAKCGADLENPQNNTVNEESKTDFSDVINNITNTEDTTAEFDAADIEKNKVYALFAYLGILILFPILAAKDSKYARFHINQGLVLIIVNVAWNIITAVLGGILKNIAIIYSVYSILASVISLALFALAVMGIVYAVTGKAKKLPIIGKFTLLK